MSKICLSPFFFWYAFVCTRLQHKMAFKRSAVRRRLRRHNRIAVCVKQRRQASCASVVMENIVDAGLRVDPDFKDIQNPLLIHFLKAVHPITFLHLL